MTGVDTMNGALIRCTFLSAFVIAMWGSVAPGQIPPDANPDPCNCVCDKSPSCSEDGNCSDGNVCNGIEVCTDGECSLGTPLDCGDDGDVCNGFEYCEPFVGCQSTESLICDDGDVCNGLENCDPELGCMPGSPISCDGCTGNNIAHCDTETGCICVPPPCEVNACGNFPCDSETGLCLVAIGGIPTLSGWGLIALACSFVIAGTIVFRNRWRELVM